MRHLSIVLLAVAAPAVLHAECPTGADLASGIAFTGLDGDREVFTDLGDGIVSASYLYPNGFRTEALLAQGAFLIELLDLVGSDGETRTKYSFPLEIKEIQPPEPGESWDVTVSVSDGDHNVFERQIYSFGSIEQHSYGGCTYDVIPFTAEYSTLPEVVETYHFLPALGLSYLYSYVDPVGEATYPYTKIEALR